MARKKGALDAVQFTRESAERIAGVVRAAEQTPTPTLPLTFERLQETRLPKSIRSATFSGAWPIGSIKVVTFANLPTNTANVQNLSWPITSSGYSNEPCLVGKEGTAWYLIVPRLQTATAIFVSSISEQAVITGSVPATVATGISQGTYATGFETLTAVSDVSISATLNTNDCAITIGKTVTTTEIRSVSGTATAFFASGTSIVNVCGDSALITVIGGTAASTFLRVRVP